MISLYNTLSRKIEPIASFDPQTFKMYVCGPTVYDHIHIGNARCFVIYDLLYRTISTLYNQVIYVRNLTDVDDKIDAKVKETGVNINDLTSANIKSFHDDLAYLNCIPPTVEPKATDFIDHMISFIQKLIENNSAYVTNEGSVYFNVSSYDDYYLLSGRSKDAALAATRVKSEVDKRHLEDFVLWKPADDTDCIWWNSPWGRGRPGWHTECSVMSHEYLGARFDLHGGGIDLIFPHHTNELAQGCMAYDTKIKYWVHSGTLKINGNKMSKSLGNFVSVKDLIASGVQGGALRMFFLSCHYRKPLDFTLETLAVFSKKYEQILQILSEIDDKNLAAESHDPDEPVLQALYQDLNTSIALRHVYQELGLAAKSKTSDAKQLHAHKLRKYCKQLGVL